jgi:hypothetical protein
LVSEKKWFNISKNLQIRKLVLVLVHFYHHIFATNLPTKLPHKQMLHIFAMFVIQNFVANQIGNSLRRRLGERVCKQVCGKNAMVEEYLSKKERFTCSQMNT